ncbi:hypothetical protein CKA32_002378 [Geitlerinema sp. FC II]|nr:hypothetical protein CKA32_002378 [Geitlerinema sp. FC II]
MSRERVRRKRDFTGRPEPMAVSIATMGISRRRLVEITETLGISLL